MTASKTEHTKGPLQVLITDGETMKGANCVLISENGDQVARCSAPFPFDTSWNERDANAHRLALAWNCHDELLAALQDAVALADRNKAQAEAEGRWVIRPPEMQGMYDACVAVIAKATGSHS